MNNKYSIFLSCLLSILIGGCDSSNDEVPDNLSDTDGNGYTADDVSISIDTFTISGTSEPVNGVIPINANIDSGKFDISWKVSINDEIYKMILNLKKAGSDGPARTIFSGTCGDDQSAYVCGSETLFNCTFGTDNFMECEFNNLVNNFVAQGNNLSSYLTSLPEDMVFTLTACDQYRVKCIEKNLPIQLQ